MLVPIIKDKCDSKDNCRPIALDSIVSKKIENIIFIVGQNVSYTVNNVTLDLRKTWDRLVYLCPEVSY